MKESCHRIGIKLPWFWDFASCFCCGVCFVCLFSLREISQDASGCVCRGLAELRLPVQPAGENWPCLAGLVGLELWAQAAGAVMHLMEVLQVLERSLPSPGFQ